MTDIIVAGLPGTGKKLVSEVLTYLGYDFGSVEDSQRTTLVCKDICLRLHPDEYPYYLVYDGWSVISEYHTPIMPEGIVVAFPTALPTLLYHYTPTTLYYCRRRMDAWIKQVTLSYLPKNIDHDHLSKVWECDSSTLAEVTIVMQAHGARRVVEFNVDVMQFQSQDIQADDLLNRLLAQMLKKNPKLGL